MRILFLGYWGLRDGLTTSTVFPHLLLLQERTDVEAIRLVTIERGADAQVELRLELDFDSSKISFKPLRSKPSRNVILNKIEDFTRFPRELVQQVQEFQPDIILARGTPAGALAYLVWRKIRLPFYVESFEPHADYMLESGVWRRYDPRYLFQRYWEQRQKQLALGLMPVAENYKQQLIAEGVPSQRIVTVPCSVNAIQFAYDESARQQMRKRLGWLETDVVGVYVGKFGGIYYDKEAFQVFRLAADFFGASFRLIILTPDSLQEVRTKLAAVGLATEKVFVTKASHHDVPKYLSSADFAFATIKPAPCRLFCSAIKIGEYWANGLPVVLPEGIGDDSDIIKQEGGGAIFNIDRPISVSEALTSVAQQIVHLAERYRSIELSRQAYTHFFGVPAL
jgi:hypothetical protein